jgi:glycosyltransferase involved in cell wall biosynthesis
MQRVLVLMDKILCWHATHIYPEGQGVKEDLVAYSITQKPLKIIANGNVNGIDTNHFSSDAISLQTKTDLKNELDISSNDFVFIFVGRLVGDKGINELVEAFEGLGIREQGLGTREQGLGTRDEGLGTRDEGLDESLELSITSEVSLLPDFSCSFSRIKLLLVGPFESELDPLLSKTISAIESNPNIISVGFQADVRPYLAISNCLVFPSYREGFPNVVLQAGAMGLPSIVTNINGCNEIIEEGINGLIIPPKDIIALQNAMINLLEDKSVYKNLKNNARQMITSRYEQKLVWEALLEEYRRLLEGIRD